MTQRWREINNTVSNWERRMGNGEIIDVEEILHMFNVVLTVQANNAHSMASSTNTSSRTTTIVKQICIGVTTKGKCCGYKALSGQFFCGIHARVKKPKVECECSICTDIIVDFHKMSCCGQSFCKCCINTWLKHNKSCPLCRKTI